jgi:hypothetical protein
MFSLTLEDGESITYQFSIKIRQISIMTLRYQKILVLFAMCNAMLLAYCNFAPILVLFVPDHHCAPNPELIGIMNESDLFNLTIPVDDYGERDKCHMYNVRFCWHYLTVIIISQVVKLSGH